MFKYLFKYLNFFFNKKISFKFSKTQKKEIVLFDGESHPHLKKLLSIYDYKIIDNRPSRINEVYCSLNFIINFIINIFLLFRKNKNLQTTYFYTLFKIINPKVVITSIDNSFKFSELAKLLAKKINFIAIQNADRKDFSTNTHKFNIKLATENLNKKFYIPNYFCFGQYEEDNCKLYDIQVDKFYKFGSIRLANFFEYIQINQIKLNKSKYDICLISEPSPGLSEAYGIKTIEKGFSEIARYTINFSRKHNLKFIFANKRPSSSDLFKKEIQFYKENLNDEDYSYLISNIPALDNKNQYSSYFAMFESKVVVAKQSTLLKEKIGCGEKILSCNLTNFSAWDFPIKGNCSINNCDYNEFEERLKKILKLSNEEYFKNNSLHQSYIMNFDRNLNTINKIRNKLDNFLDY